MGQCFFQRVAAVHLFESFEPEVYLFLPPPHSHASAISKKDKVKYFFNWPESVGNSLHATVGGSAMRGRVDLLSEPLVNSLKRHIEAVLYAGYFFIPQSIDFFWCYTFRL